MMGTWPIALTGRLEAGRILFSRRSLEKALKGRKDCDVEILIERQHATRSLAQNRLYWGVYVKLLSEHTGYTPEEVHELLKAKFLPKTFALPDEHGEASEFVLGRSTTRLNKIEFGEYLQAIQQWAAEALDVVVPDPPHVDALDDRRQAVAR